MGISTVASGTRERTAARRALRRLRGDTGALVGTAIVLAMVFLALLAPVVAPHPVDQFVTRRLQGPSLQHLLGSDELGRDTLSRLIFGGRVSLLISIAAVALSGVGGTLIGLVSGFSGGRLDNLLMRTMDVILAFPVILLALVIVSLLGPSVWNVILAIAVVYAPRFARVVRGGVLVVREELYVEAARSIGAGAVRVMIRHVLPNIVAIILIQATISLAWAMLVEASLSFLGLGTPPSVPSWGSMLNQGKVYMQTAPWVAIFPGLAIMLAVMGFNLLGDGLREALDPRMNTAQR